MEKAGTAELRERLLAALKQPPGMERTHALELICARWAEIDPANGLDFVASLGGNTDPAPRVMLLKEWAIEDLDAAWDYLAAHPGREVDDDLRTVGTGLLTEDPALFVQWFWRAPGHLGQPDAGSPAWLAAARAKPEELQAIALKILELSPTARNGSPIWNPKTGALFTLLGAARAETDSKAVFKWARSLPDPYRVQALKGAFATLARVSPQIALDRLDMLAKGKSPEWLRSLFDSEGPHDFVNGPNALTLLGQQDPMILVELARKYPALEPVNSLVDTFGMALAAGKLDPATAFRAIDSISPGDGTVPAAVLSRMWNALPPGQLRGAAEAVAREPDSGAKMAAMSGIMKAWFATEPSAALDFGKGVADAELRRALYRQLVGDLATGSFETLRHVPVEDRGAVIASSLENMDQWITEAGPSPIESLRLENLAPFLADLPPSADSLRAVTSLAGTWSQLDPRAAIEWASRQKDNPTRAACVASAIQGWAHHDSNGAAVWLDAQPPGSIRDAATLPLVAQLKDTEPESAWEWAGTISNPTLRSQTRREAFAAWAAADPDAAAAALDTAPGLSAADFLALSQTLVPP